MGMADGDYKRVGIIPQEMLWSVKLIVSPNCPSNQGGDAALPCYCTWAPRYFRTQHKFSPLKLAYDIIRGCNGLNIGGWLVLYLYAGEEAFGLQRTTAGSWTSAPHYNFGYYWKPYRYGNRFSNSISLFSYEVVLDLFFHLILISICSFSPSPGHKFSIDTDEV